MSRGGPPAGALLAALAVATLAALLDAAEGRAAPAAPGAHRPSVTSGLDCDTCHTTSSWKTVGMTSGQTGFDHTRTGFPLTQRHQNVPCSGCHRSDHQLTRQCSGCHADAHQGQLGAACDGCHSAATWYQTEAFVRHRQTRLPLTGMHALVECRDCHQRSAERQWTTVAADCFACHEADYRRPEIHPLHVGVPGDPTQPPFPRDCQQCHRATGWLPVFVAVPVLGNSELALASGRAHDRLFPISRGPHRGAECSACHLTPSTPRAVRCDGCHAHNQVTLLEQHRGVGAFGAACIGCHPGGSVR